MTRDRDIARTVHEWLEHGATALPDRVLDAVLDEVAMTPQRRRPIGRWLLGNQGARALGMAAACVLGVAVIGVANVLAPNVAAPPPGGGPPTPRAATALPPDGTRLAPGAYSISAPIPLSFEVPAGLRACAVGSEPAVCGMSIAELGFMTIVNVVSDPCAGPPTLRDPPVGPSVTDLVEALRGLPGFDVRSVRDVVVDGYQGVELEITAPDRACNLRPWASPQRINGVASRETNRMRIIDVNGTRVVMALAYHPNTPPADVAALQETMDSVRFTTP
jgi:hypothetical protein